MEQIDRLGWAAGFSIRAYGCTIGIRVSDAALLDRTHAALPFGWKPSANPRVERLYSLLYGGDSAAPGIRRFHLLYGNWTRLCRTLHLDEAFAALAADLRRFVAESARTRVFLHAGVVGWKGRAILLLGPADAERSTLVDDLVRAGARSYSDDFAVVDARGRVHPFPLPTSLDVQGPTEHSAESRDRRNGRVPLSVGLIINRRYEEGATWQPRTLTPGEAMQAILAHTVAADRATEMVHRVVEQVVAAAPVLDGPRGEAQDTVPLVLVLLGAASAQRLNEPDPRTGS